MKNYILILIAVSFDLLIGDPTTVLHPVRLIGNLISKIEILLFKLNISKRVSGFTAVCSTLLIVIALYFIIYSITVLIPFGKEIFSILIFYSTIAIKDLFSHGMRVKRALDDNNIILARKKAGMILSRNTENLSQDKIIKGTLESISENSSDSIIAPLFWGLLLGPLGSLIYRTINTMDAMWGYKNNRFIDFGKTAAILDDIVNFLPARLTGLLICAAGLFTKGSAYNAWKIMIRDHSNTASPNAGYPEAAMAGILGVQLGGNAVYFGKTVIKQTLGDKQREPETGDISYSIVIIGFSVALFLLLTALLMTILNNW